MKTNAERLERLQTLIDYYDLDAQDVRESLRLLVAILADILQEEPA